MRASPKVIGTCCLMHIPDHSANGIFSVARGRNIVETNVIVVRILHVWMVELQNLMPNTELLTASTHGAACKGGAPTET